MTAPTTVPPDALAARKPRDDEIDVYGLTHPGSVRKSNQDHFHICSLRRVVHVVGTSLPDVAAGPEEDRMAFLAMVADGVGSSAQGGEASRFAVQAITDYVTQSMRAYYAAADTVNDEGFALALRTAAEKVHHDLLKRAKSEPGGRGMATTLTLFLGVWPRAYLLQLGDSRCYIHRDGRLTQITRDQTMAQDLVDQGVLTRTEAPRTRWAHVLSSAIGGHQTAPVVSRIESVWHQSVLLCSDGLTKHVPDDQIAERLRTMTSARQACEQLLTDALAGGGSDNITMILGRAVPRPAAT